MHNFTALICATSDSQKNASYYPTLVNECLSYSTNEPFVSFGVSFLKNNVSFLEISSRMVIPFSFLQRLQKLISTSLPNFLVICCILLHHFWLYHLEKVPGVDLMTFDFILSRFLCDNGNKLFESLIISVVFGLELTIVSASMNIVSSYLSPRLFS